jgi:hypothetical protein
MIKDSAYFLSGTNIFQNVLLEVRKGMAPRSAAQERALFVYLRPARKGGAVTRDWNIRMVSLRFHKAFTIMRDIN